MGTENRADLEQWLNSGLIFNSDQERELFQAQLRLWVWDSFTVVVLGVMYFGLMSEGLRVMVPGLATKVYKIPGLSFLYNYEATHRLDLGHFMAIGLLVAVMMTWTAVVELWLGVEGRFRGNRSAQERHSALVVLLAWVLLGGEAYIFYSAIGVLGWSGSGFSLVALIATAVYLAMMVAVTHRSVCLRKAVRDLKKERNDAMAVEKARLVDRHFAADGRKRV